jgi:hypothetical protein
MSHHRALSNGGKWHPRHGRTQFPIVPVGFCVIMLSVSALQFYISTVSIQQNVAHEQYPQPPSSPLVENADRSEVEPIYKIEAKETTIGSTDPIDEDEEDEDYAKVIANQDSLLSRQIDSEEKFVEEEGISETEVMHTHAKDAPIIVDDPPRRRLPSPRVVQWSRVDDDPRFAYFSTTTSVAAPPTIEHGDLREDWIEDSYESTTTNVIYDEDKPNPIKEAMVQKFLDECVPMATWQTQSFPTCNTLHEMDITSTAATMSTNETEYESSSGFQHDFAISLLSDQGSWRSVWKVQRDLSWSQSAPVTSGIETLVLKLLKFQRRDFNAESYEHHRIDAMAMERLTASNHIVNVFGYCGQSVVTEYASTTARLLTKNTTLTSLDRLKMGRDIVQAMMDLHSIDYPNATNITFTHNDLNMANAVAVQGHIKLNDFNIGVMQRWNKTTNAICKTPVLFEAPLWKSPEEIISSERIQKEYAPEDDTIEATISIQQHPALNTEHWVLAGPTDVFGLGNLLFQVLTKRQPWTHLEPDGAKNASDAGRRKVRGEQPFVPPKYHAHNTSKVALAALHYAVMLCYRTDPVERPTSYQLWRQLNTAIAWIEERGGKVYPRELEELFLGSSEVEE